MTFKRRKQQYAAKPVVLPEEHDVRRAKRLPMFGPGIVLVIPLLLWPAYKELYQLDIKGYRESTNTLLVKRQPQSAQDIWHCLACDGEPEFIHAEMLKHLQEVHNIIPATAEGTKTMVMHLDASDATYSTYEYEINGLKFRRQERRNRKKAA